MLARVLAAHKALADVEAGMLSGTMDVNRIEQAFCKAEISGGSSQPRLHARVNNGRTSLSLVVIRASASAFGGEPSFERWLGYAVASPRRVKAERKVHWRKPHWLFLSQRRSTKDKHEMFGTNE